jgi:hypothetical protein
LTVFEENPCRWNLFEVFQIDRSLTDKRAINERVRLTRDQWKFNQEKVLLRNGALCAIEESRLNELEGRLSKPLQRLKDEQFAHQFHSFAGDDELLGAVKGLTEVTAPAQMPSVAGAALVGAIGPLLPAITPPRLEDDLPWPDPPEAFSVKREPLEDAILRDC